MKKIVYVDNAATTPVAPEVIEEMQRYFYELWGNPSSLHTVGQLAKTEVESARVRIAAVLGCSPKEIFFTSCGSESDNWAIKGTVYASKNCKHIISTAYEHHAVLHTMKSLKAAGYEVTELVPDADGIISSNAVEKAIRPDTGLICVMFANNEIGSINPIKEIAEVAKAHKIPFFCDGVQAVGHLPVNVSDLGVNMLSFSGHKFNAPKGIGGLYIKAGTRISNLIEGGGQERNKRGGTENVPYIMGMAKALELAVSKLDDNARIRAMRDRLAEGLSRIPHSRINGGMKDRLPGNLNMSFEFVEGESLLLLADMEGICLSTGSACSSTSLEPSHVLLSIGVPVEVAHGSLRFSLSHQNTDEDVDYLLEKIPQIVEKLRALSPLC